MTIKKIEKEYKQPFKEIVKDFASHIDYMGYGYGIYFVAGILNMYPMQLYRYCEKNKIKFIKSKSNLIPSKIEDNCWVKYGIDLKKYLITHHKWLSNKEMAKDLDVTEKDISVYLVKYDLKGKELTYGMWSKKQKRNMNNLCSDDKGKCI